MNPASSMRARILPALLALTASGLMMANVRSVVISKEVYTRGEFKGQRCREPGAGSIGDPNWNRLLVEPELH